MSKNRLQNEKTDKAKHHLWNLWVALLVLFVVAIVCCLTWQSRLWNFRSVDEQLAAIEAARAIPDSENAAIIYNQLLEDPNATSVLDYYPEFFDEASFNQTLNEPWLNSDYPQLAAWIKQHQYIIDKLLDASEFEKCRFPIIIDIMDTRQMDRAISMRQWAYFLSFAANNDLAENRVEAAMTKWRAIIQMGHHLSQQPMIIDQIVAHAVGMLALEHIARFVIDGNATEENLQKIEALPLQIKDHWAELRKQISNAENLPEEKLIEQFGPIDRLKFQLYHRKILETVEEPDVSGKYKQHIATARGVRILVALRRYMNKHGRWPTSLDEIKSQVPAEILVDPLNKGSFVYKLTDDCFILYSKGQNNIDDDGKRDKWNEEKTGADDWLIWPKSKEKNTDAKQD